MNLLDAISAQGADPQALLAHLQAEAERRVAENRLRHYEPYPRQAEFHALGATKRERLLRAGNQLGKCATGATFMELEDGSRATFGQLYARGEPFRVKSWNGSEVVGAWAVQPIMKPAEPCVRLWFSDGSWFECALNHRVLLASGKYAFVGDLLSHERRHQPCEPNRQASNSEHGPRVRGEGEPSSLETLRGFPAYCLAGLRFCDAQLHRVSEGVRAFARQLSDALRRSFASFYVGACSSIHASSGQSERGLRASSCDQIQTEGRSAGFLDQIACSFARRTKWSIQAIQRRVLALVVAPQSRGAVFQHQSLQGAYENPGCAGNNIVAYEVISSQPVYDFSVPAHGCYVSNGIVHHNTLAAGFETAMHLTGRYPDWWQGRRFDKPIVAWVGGVTAEATRDGAQRILLGRQGSLGTGTVPAKYLSGSPLARQGVADAVAIAKVKHRKGSTSTIIFKSYDQGREKWQGDTIDVCWFDEEPPEDVYIEGLTRTNAGGGGKGGIVYLTFTPLLGMSSVVKRFIPLTNPDRGDVVMTIDDVAHYTPEQKASIIASYPPHEREARTKGIPTLGSGRVFPVTEDSIRWKPVELPRYVKRIIGIDFGWDHPTAAAWLAWDADSDVVYVTDAYRVSEQTPVIHSAAIKARSRNQKIPVAWPHDGLQHDKGSGLQLAAQYRDLGLDMLPEQAKFVDGSNGVEAGVSEMLQRMQTGRLRVAEHLADWFEEFRLYHREDGKIVKEGDDLLCATRYGLMCLRFARIADAGRDAYRPPVRSGSASWVTA